MGSMVNKKPKLVLVSSGIRRDLHQPLRYFRAFSIFHLYRDSEYGDMETGDFYHPRAIRYQGMVDLYQKIRRLKPDILQTAEPWANNLALKITLVCYWYSILNPRIKLIFPCFENVPLNQKFSRLVARTLQWWAKILAKRTVRIFYLNRGARQNLLDCGIKEVKLQRANWGTWGIDLEEFKPRSEALELKRKRALIIFVGKISRAKGVPWLIDAFEGLNAELPQARLVLAGPLADADWLKNIRSNVKIEYIGAVKNKDLPPLFRRAALTVAPSVSTRQWIEQVGMVNLQSMACGTPVVSTHSGAIPEYIKDGQGCRLVQEKDAQAIRAAMKEFLLQSRFYAEQTKKAREWIENHYAVRENIAKLEKILLRLL